MSEQTASQFSCLQHPGRFPSDEMVAAVRPVQDKFATRLPDLRALCNNFMGGQYKEMAAENI